MQDRLKIYRKTKKFHEPGIKLLLLIKKYMLHTFSVITDLDLEEVMKIHAFKVSTQKFFHSITNLYILVSRYIYILLRLLAILSQTQKYILLPTDS